ncbi:Ankyrin-2 [Lambiella insularis]|nr:Ankyrin-2 [Lambiella insularis]
MEVLGTTVTVASLVTSVATLATTLTTLRERYKYAALNITLVTSSLLVIKAALEQIKEWRSTTAEKTRSSQQLDRDLQISLESCALVVAVIERKLSETDLLRPSIVDKVRYMNLDAIYKDFAAHLDGQIRALQLILTIFQCRSISEQNEKLDQQETRSVFQQVQDSTASLQLEERDLQDAASILSENPSVNLDVDVILMNHPLYQRVYKNQNLKYYKPLPSLKRTISRKPLGHAKSKSADYVERPKTTHSVDPFFEQYAALPFLGVPFKGESPRFAVEEFHGEEGFTGVVESEEQLQVEQAQSLAVATEHLEVCEELAMTTIISPEKDPDARKNRNTLEDEPQTVLTPYIKEASASIGFNDKAETPKDTSSVITSEEPASTSQPTALFQAAALLSIDRTEDTQSFSSSSISRPQLTVPTPTSTTDGQISALAIDNVEPKSSAAETPDQMDGSSPNQENVFSVPASNQEHSLNILEGTLTQIHKVPTTVKRSSSVEVPAPNDIRSQTAPESDPFDINFGPDPVLEIADLQTISNPQPSEESRIEHDSSMSTPSATHTIHMSTMLPQEAVVTKLSSPGPGPSRSVPSPIPVVVEPAASIIEEIVHDTADAHREARQRVSMLMTGMKKEYPAEREGSVSSSESQGRRTLKSIPTSSTPTQPTTLDTNSVRSSHERAQSELRQLQLEHNDAKGKGNAQTAKEAIKKSIAIIQKTYLADSKTGLKAADKSPRRLSSMARLSMVSLNPLAEKGRAINTAASTGNFHLLVQLLEQNPKLTDTLTSQPDSQGASHARTPLMCAAIAGHIHCMEVLRSYSANPAAFDKEGKTALHLAVEARQTEVVEWLLRSGVEVVTAAGRDIQSLKFADLNDADGLTALHVAAATGQVEIISILLAHRANLEAADRWGRTPLHYAVINLQDASTAKLVRMGSNINAVDDTNSSPLVWSAKVNSMTSMALLSQNGANTKLRDLNSETVIHHASRIGNLAAINMLYKELEELEAKNKLGETPLHIACSADHSLVVRAILKAGIQANPWTEPPLLKSSTLKAVTKPFRKTTKESKILYSSTPLHYSCFSGHYESTELLLKNGAWVNAALDDGMSPLMLAVESGNVRLAQLLLEHGAKINAKTTKHCLTALHLACYNGHLEMTKLLVNFGGDTRALSIASIPPETPALYGIRGGDKSQAAVSYLVSLNTTRQWSSRTPSNINSPMVYNATTPSMHQQSPAMNSSGGTGNYFNPREYRQYFDPEGVPPSYPSGHSHVPSSGSSSTASEKQVFR